MLGCGGVDPVILLVVMLRGIDHIGCTACTLVYVWETCCWLNVRSDQGAAMGILTDHKYAKTLPEAAAFAVSGAQLYSGISCRCSVVCYIA